MEAAVISRYFCSYPHLGFLLKCDGAADPMGVYSFLKLCTELVIGFYYCVTPGRFKFIGLNPDVKVL